MQCSLHGHSKWSDWSGFGLITISRLNVHTLNICSRTSKSSGKQLLIIPQISVTKTRLTGNVKYEHEPTFVHAMGSAGWLPGL